MRLLFVIPLLVVAACAAPKEHSGPDFSDPDFVITSVEGSQMTRATKYKDDKIIEQGTLLNNKKHGVWTQYHPVVEGKAEKIEHYEFGLLHGATIDIQSSGQISRYQEFLHGKPDGLKVNHNFGKISDITPYSMGEIHGTFKGFYGNGKLQQTIEYNRGKKHGLLIYYDDTGTPTLQYEYINDEKQHSETLQ